MPMFGKKWPLSEADGVADKPDHEISEPRPRQRVSRDVPVAPEARVEPAAPGRRPENPGPGRLIIGVGITLQGNIECCKDLVVAGFVAAETARCERITVTESGTFEGCGEFGAAVVDGAADGEITVRNELRVGHGGRVSGRVRYGSIEVARGGNISGDFGASPTAKP